MLLDIGCGVASTCMLAARFFPIRKAIGIEQNESHMGLFYTMQNEMIKKSILPKVPVEYIPVTFKIIWSYWNKQLIAIVFVLHGSELRYYGGREAYH